MPSERRARGAGRGSGSTRRRNAPWLLPTVVLFVILPIVVGGASAYSSWRADRPPKLSRGGSTKVATTGGERWRIDKTPMAYRVRYAIERYDKTAIARSTDEIEVRRPFESRVSAIVKAKATDVRVSRLGALVLSTGAGARTFVSPPTPGSADLRFDAVLDEAVESKAIERREQRKVLGRRCQVYRAGGTIQAGDLVPVGSKAGEHADFCVDHAGIVLEELWFKDDKPLRRRVAVRVDDAVTMTDSRFTLPAEQAVPATQGNGFMKPVDPSSAFEGVAYRLQSAPEGYEYLGRWVVQPPQLSPFSRDPFNPQPAGGEQVSLVDVWTKGPNFVALYQTIAADLSAVPSSPEVSHPVDLPVGKGTAFLDLRVNEVRLELAEARFLRVMGTLPTSELVAIASNIRAEQGTGVKFL